MSKAKALIYITTLLIGLTLICCPKCMARDREDFPKGAKVAIGVFAGIMLMPVFVLIGARSPALFSAGKKVVNKIKGVKK